MIRRKSTGNQKPSTKFIDLVEDHEREWGKQRYQGKPKLKDILDATVVAFWQVEGEENRLMITLHNDLSDVEKSLTRQLFTGSVNAPRKRLVRVYQDQKRMVIAGVSVIFQPAPDED